MAKGGIEFEIPGTLVALVQSVDNLPVVIRDRHMNVVMSNRVAQELSGAFAPRTNIARFVFLGMSQDEEGGAWIDASGQLTSALRDSLEQHEEDAVFRELIGELASQSHTFATEWAHDNRPAPRAASVRILHPVVGPIDMDYQELLVPNDFEYVVSIWKPSDNPCARKAFDRLCRLL